jgi:TetR/AcrR family transcriptional repressor of mexJK operon
MPRAAGQIDPRKSEAILEAASTLFHELGGAVSMEAIARKAGVSKQTLYNRFASKTELARALAEQRSEAITAPLRTDGDPEAVLTALATALITKICSARKAESLRGVALMSPAIPGIAEAIYDGGPAEGLRRLTVWLAEQDRKGLLSIPDPAHAAEMFTGMAIGHGHLRALLGLDHPEVDIAARARETARRFIRAFAV